MNRSISSSLPVVSSGYSALDRELPQSGWPIGALTEILVPQVGYSELNLLGPLLRRLTKAGRTVALLVPPYLSYAPTLIQQGVALESVRVIRMAQPLEGLWQIEKQVQAGEFGALVAIMPPRQHCGAESAVHSLQLAARLSCCPAFLFHTQSTPETTQAAGLRILADMSEPGMIQVQCIPSATEALLRPLQAAQETVTSSVPNLAQKIGPVLVEVVRHVASVSLRRVPTPQAAQATAAQHPVPAQHPAPTPGSRNPSRNSFWPFKQRRPQTTQNLATLFARGWNA